MVYIPRYVWRDDLPVVLYTWRKAVEEGKKRQRGKGKNARPCIPQVGHQGGSGRHCRLSIGDPQRQLQGQCNQDGCRARRCKVHFHKPSALVFDLHDTRTIPFLFNSTAQPGLDPLGTPPWMKTCICRWVMYKVYINYITCSTSYLAPTYYSDKAAPQ